MGKSKCKDKILKAAREINIIIKGATARLTVDFLSYKVEAKRQCNDIFKMPKENKC